MQHQICKKKRFNFVLQLTNFALLQNAILTLIFFSLQSNVIEVKEGVRNDKQSNKIIIVVGLARKPEMQFNCKKSRIQTLFSDVTAIKLPKTIFISQFWYLLQLDFLFHLQFPLKQRKFVTRSTVVILDHYEKKPNYENSSKFALLSTMCFRD